MRCVWVFYLTSKKGTKHPIIQLFNMPASSKKIIDLLKLRTSERGLHIRHTIVITAHLVNIFSICLASVVLEYTHSFKEVAVGCTYRSSLTCCNNLIAVKAIDANVTNSPKSCTLPRRANTLRIVLNEPEIMRIGNFFHMRYMATIPIQMNRNNCLCLLGYLFFNTVRRNPPRMLLNINKDRRRSNIQNPHALSCFQKKREY